MTIDVYSIFWNEEAMLSYFLRHYGLFARKIVLFDNDSTDQSCAIAESNPLVEVRPYPTGGEFREDSLLYAKGQAWREERDKPDWVIACDINEFLVHPDLVGYLAECKSRGITVPVPRGWNMVADTFPSTPGQIYDEVTEGFATESYSKNCVFNPTAIEDMGFQAGCHTYQPRGRAVEHFSGRLRLLHFKWLGAEYLASRHTLQLERLGDFNKQRGYSGHLSSWSACLEMFAANRPNVVRINEQSDPRKVHLGCGFNRLTGWENHDADLDFSKPLPFEDESVRFFLVEEVFEHLKPCDSIGLLKECFRCLQSNGVLRLCVPCIENIIQRADAAYLQFASQFGVAESIAGAVDAIVCGHGHQSVWTTELLLLLARVYGFDCTVCEPRQSEIEELRNIDSHWKSIGEHNNFVETTVLECRRPPQSVCPRRMMGSE